MLGDGDVVPVAPSRILEGFKEASEEVVEEADEEAPDPAGEASRTWPAWPRTFALDATAGSGSSSADLEEGFEEASEEASEEAAEEGPDPAGRSSFPAINSAAGSGISLGHLSPALTRATTCGTCSRRSGGPACSRCARIAGGVPHKVPP